MFKVERQKAKYILLQRARARDIFNDSGSRKVMKRYFSRDSFRRKRLFVNVDSPR